MSIKINRLEEGHNSYPLVCRRPAETIMLCYFNGFVYRLSFCSQGQHFDIFMDNVDMVYMNIMICWNIIMVMCIYFGPACFCFIYIFIQDYSGQYKNKQIINNKLLLIVLLGKCTNCTATAWR
jgi:hypothetical protein